MPDWPTPYVLREQPSVGVARVGLGLTVYLADAVTWASEAAALLLRDFLRVAPRAELLWYTTSRLTVWNRVAPDDLDQLVEVLSTPWTQRRVRHCFSFRLANDVGAPDAGFWYHEVEPSRAGVAGFVQIVLPTDSPPDDLLQLATAVGHSAPVWSFVGGYLATFHPHVRPTAFWCIHAWCRRYLGLDVQDPEQGGQRAATGLLGSSWLTFLGRPLVKALDVDLDALVAPPWKGAVEATSLLGGTLLKAGAAPVLGDLNRMQYPTVYAEVARRLAPLLVQEPPRFPGKFRVEDDVQAWMHRFVDTREWAGTAW